MKSPNRIAVLILVTVLEVGCGHGPKIDYEHANPALDARRAMLDSGHFHMVAVKVGDSVISPSDTTAYTQRSYNLAVGPEGPVVYLPVDNNPKRPGWPSDAQLRYITGYNTELFALLDTNYMRARLPPNKRLKLPAPAH